MAAPGFENPSNAFLNAQALAAVARATPGRVAPPQAQPQQQPAQSPFADLNSYYTGQQQYLAQQQQARNAAYEAIIKAILGAIPSPDQVAGPYQAASQSTLGLANQSAQDLAAANPDATTQANLRAIGAPQGQMQQVGNIDNTAFNGNAALLKYTGGVIPSDVFNQDMLGRNTYLASLPGIVGNYATRGFGQLQQLANTENAALQKDYFTARQTAQNTAFDQALKTKQFNLAVGKANNQIGEFNASQALKANQLDSQNYWKGVSAKIAQQRLSAQIAHWSSQQAIAKAKADAALAGKTQKPPKINTAVSNLLGYLADSSGNPIGAKNGKPIYTNTLPPKLAKERPLVSAAIDAAIQKGQDAQTTYDQLLGVGQAPGSLIKQEVILKYGVAKVPNWMVSGLTATTRAAAGQAIPLGALSAQQKNAANIIAASAQRYGLDPRAILAVSQQEGWGGGVGDSGTSFGPFQMHIGGALPKAIAAKGADYAQQWAWSPAGINYALRQMATVARGLTGKKAVAAIVNGFEKPRNPARETTNAIAAYGGQPGA